jgi:hypothetical protein
MKNLFKLIVIIAVIVFTITACPDDSSNDNDTKDNKTDVFVAVTSITDIPMNGTAGISLTLKGTVNPITATNKEILWSIAKAGTTSATLDGNTLNTTAVGTVTVRATISNGLAQGIHHTQEFDIIINPFVAVTSISGVPDSGRVGISLTLNGIVDPDNATNKAIVWTIANVGTTSATLNENTLSATTAGTVTVRATIINGSSPINNYTQDFSINIVFVSVTSIYGVPSSGAVGIPLTLSSTVNPDTATNKDIVWSVQSGSATVNGNTLIATALGTVTVRATIVNGLAQGSNFTRDFTISFNRIYDPGWNVTTFAGSGVSGYADGQGTSARFDYPIGVAVDSTGNVYVADKNRIRKIAPSGTVSTLAGNNTYGYADGQGTSVRFDGPEGLAVDSAGNVYVADFYNNRIRKITPSGTVSTIAGPTSDIYSYGYVDGQGASARFNYPVDVAVDNAGNVYVADEYNHRIRKITPSGMVSTLAGGGYGTDSFGFTIGGYADGQGISAKFNHPCGVAVDSAGNVYVVDKYNHRIRKITPSGTVSTLAGSGAVSDGKTITGGGNVDGLSISAMFHLPYGVVVDNAGNIYVSNSSAIRKITQSPTVMVSTVAGGNYGYADGSGAFAKFDNALSGGVAVDSAGNIYVADSSNYRIRKISK